MALIIITVQDTKEGSVDVRLNTEPAIDPDKLPIDFTMAERMGAVALNAIHGALEEKSHVVMDGGSSKIFLPN